MKVKPLNDDLTSKLLAYQIERKFKKQVKLLELNQRHPSLNFEVLKETKHLKLPLYSFRIDRKYRAVGLKSKDKRWFEITYIGPHY